MVQMWVAGRVGEMSVRGEDTATGAAGKSRATGWRPGLRGHGGLGR